MLDRLWFVFKHDLWAFSLSINTFCHLFLRERKQFWSLFFCHSHLFWFLFLKVILNKSRMECKLTLTLCEVKVAVILVLFDIHCSEAHQRGTINAFCPQNNWIQDFTNTSTSCSSFPTPCCISAWNVSVQRGLIDFCLSLGGTGGRITNCLWFFETSWF